jgi:hypothetical protein
MMRKHYETVFQMTDDPNVYVRIFDDWEAHEGEVALCKGDDAAKQAEAQQAAFNSQLMSIFQTQFSKNSQILDYLTTTLKPMIDNPQGYSPEALATLRTQAKESAANATANAQQAYQTQAYAHGGRDLPSGVDAQVEGSISSAGAQQEAGAQQNITLANENLKQANFWNAISSLSGNAAQFNPLGYANAATSGGNTVANLSQANTSSQQSGLLSGLLGGAFGAGSALLGNPALFKHS